MNAVDFAGIDLPRVNLRHHCNGRQAKPVTHVQQNQNKKETTPKQKRNNTETKLLTATRFSSRFFEAHSSSSVSTFLPMLLKNPDKCNASFRTGCTTPYIIFKLVLGRNVQWQFIFLIVWPHVLCNIVLFNSPFCLPICLPLEYSRIRWLFSDIH